MKQKLIRALAGALLLGTSVLAVTPPADAHDAYPEQRCLLGWIPYWDQRDAMASFYSNVTLFETASFFWYYLGKNGEIRTYRGSAIDTDAIEWAREHHVKTLAIITNMPKAGREHWDWKRVERVIESAEARAAHIADLVTLTHRLGVDGINIDYENLRAQHREDFTAFIQELGSALHDEGKLLAVALHPKTSEGDPTESNGSQAQDWEAIHPYVDQMHFMTYGETTVRSSGPTGPNASPDWMSRVLHHAIDHQGVPRDKVYLGVPLYGESWSKVKASRYRMDGDDLTYNEVMRLEQRYGGVRGRDEASDTPYLEYRDQRGRDRVVWFEDAQSVAAKARLREEYGICKLGLWRLGGEDPEVWSALALPESTSATDEDDVSSTASGSGVSEPGL